MEEEGIVGCAASDENGGPSGGCSKMEVFLIMELYSKTEVVSIQNNYVYANGEEYNVRMRRKLLIVTMLPMCTCGNCPKCNLCDQLWHHQWW
ncbi:MAG: hypothetical protein ACLTBD_09205 [Clostridia bacterium]